MTGLVTPLTMESRANDNPFWSYQDVFVVFAMIAMPCLVFAMLLIKGLVALIHAPALDKGVQVLSGQFLWYVLSLATMYFLFKLRYGRPFWRSLGWIPTPATFNCFFFGPFIAIACGTLGILLRAPDIRNPFVELMGNRLSIILLGIFVATLGPVFEELAFRGFLQPLLMRSFGVAAGIFLTALPFALLHGPQYSWSWQHISIVMLAGSAFGWARYKTRSTLASSLMHSSYNLTFFIPFLLQNRMFTTLW